MPRSRLTPGSPQDCMARAKGDLALASAPLPHGGFYEDLCFHAQQAAEKALKAVYVTRGWTFRYVHDLDELVTGLRRRGISIPSHVQEAVFLTGYAFEARYPGLTEPVTEEEYRKAIAAARRVVEWAERIIQGAPV
ncbi:MAG: HEPN domain-containing protein [candidate division KSB1 bacterium]|nr:HEPN domain-containing protein [candidate division KSB1 bacterium]